MIDFDEELKRFIPSLEISEVEDSIVKNDINDINDIIMELLRKQAKEQY
ncbi:hypothetical protein HMPREF9333_00718 [Johnsonella ignava ATCC 51276]|jgi:hypothetical protein|uniref:Uncharacterized protein n=1 Tax=Johnsonella ignava ATCC 51276 TaxID=679200 RepID=G5GGM8_9FIRM|nr:hypothetical protein [Johnsonella ignava]EHI56188.1 hypothetical protein HMPREF9333_00718 [Johnsonella ignava ATCC 51276]